MLLKTCRNFAARAIILLRRLPCEWDGTTIVVGVVGQNAVEDTAPYSSASCTGGDEKSLAHVKKVVRAPAFVHSIDLQPQPLSFGNACLSPHACVRTD